MDAPAYCSPAFAMIAHPPIYNEDPYEVYEQPYPSPHYTSSGLGDPSYSPQWFDGLHGDIVASSGAEEELYAAFLAAEVASTSAHAPSFAIPVPSPPFHGHQAPSPVFTSPLGYTTTSAAPERPLAATSGNTRRTCRAGPTPLTASSSLPYKSPVAETYPGSSPQLVACTRRNAPAPSPTAPPQPALTAGRVPTAPTSSTTVAPPTSSAISKRIGLIMDFVGVPMIGGCMKTFSRKDALMRHLKAQKGKCFGDAWSMFQPGNRLKDGEALES
ncbi:hypothetical protein DICSQDRAFT_174466 [Dichomitus squalens LYAD-421 SS1]|uniref:Uncharacterized protein n=1 Tax=Dichomitus squalens (strain LYAD-421) TaxID=732165 RepID=R7SL65_DICSQ|nr:uncharacterized protein DICSQDRAFT_174466 [Dichomitus squalens LYAD-421 SS1]EJF56879.1 hypothetical protein DICSQDRAFT_174466 [Dichomitus squalens LYAD-421 SS1]